MKNKRTWALSISAVVACITIAGALYMSHVEPTFDPRLPRPPGKPVIVAADDFMLAAALKEAVQIMNAALDCGEVFRIDSDRRQVGVYWLGDRECGADGPRTSHASYYPLCRAIIMRDGNNAVLDLQHELGHVLGLADEDTGGSIMDQPPDYSALKKGRPLPTLTEKDRKAVREMFGCQ